MLHNQPQHGKVVYQNGLPRALVVHDALAYVARPNIEAAARCGYLDGLARAGYSRHYDDAPAPWQRNYEIGRLWATGMLACGIEAPEWPEELKQQPFALNAALDEVNRRIGALRPEISGRMADDPGLPTLHVPVRISRRRR